MAIKVGINGFGRIGRNIMRAAMGDDRHRHRRRQRPDERRDAGAPAQVRLDPRQPQGRHLGHRRSHHGRRRRVPGPLDQGSGAAAVEGSSASTSSSSPPASSPTATAPPSTSPPARRRSSSPRRPRARTSRSCMGVNDEKYDAGEPPHHLERVVHDELPRAGRQGPARDLRHQEGLDDDRPLVHERPAAARPAAQGPAPRARRGAVDHPDDDRRGQRRRRGAAGAQGQARRHRDARADAERLGRRPRRDPRQEDVDGGGQRRVQGGGGRAAEGHPRVRRRRRSCRSTSAATRTRRSSTRPYTSVMDGDFVKVLSWYDNEWGYSSRCVDLLRFMVKKGL